MIKSISYFKLLPTSLGGCIKRREMLKFYPKYRLFLVSRDYLVESATMMGNECFTIIIYRWCPVFGEHRTDDAMLRKNRNGDFVHTAHGEIFHLHRSCHGQLCRREHFHQPMTIIVSMPILLGIFSSPSLSIVAIAVVSVSSGRGLIVWWWWWWWFSFEGVVP